jgi:myosin heavy chain 6/7
MKVSAESKIGALDDEVRRLRATVEEFSRQLQDLNGLKARLSQENFDLHRQVQELDSNNAVLSKAKTLLQQQLDDAKNRLDEESRVCNETLYLHRRLLDDCSCG